MFLSSAHLLLVVCEHEGGFRVSFVSVFRKEALNTAVQLNSFYSNVYNHSQIAGRCKGYFDSNRQVAVFWSAANQ